MKVLAWLAGLVLGVGAMAGVAVLYEQSLLIRDAAYLLAVTFAYMVSLPFLPQFPGDPREQKRLRAMLVAVWLLLAAWVAAWLRLSFFEGLCLVAMQALLQGLGIYLLRGKRSRIAYADEPPPPPRIRQDVLPSSLLYALPAADLFLLQAWPFVSG